MYFSTTHMRISRIDHISFIQTERDAVRFRGTSVDGLQRHSPWHIIITKERGLARRRLWAGVAETHGSPLHRIRSILAPSTVQM